MVSTGTISSTARTSPLPTRNGMKNSTRPARPVAVWAGASRGRSSRC
jgi:hypothetical protein